LLVKVDLDETEMALGARAYHSSSHFSRCLEKKFVNSNDRMEDNIQEF
jgi:hypothetical protein